MTRNLLLDCWLLLARCNVLRLRNMLLYHMLLSQVGLLSKLLLLGQVLLSHLMVGHLLLNHLLLSCMLLGSILLCSGMINLRHATTCWMELLLLLWVPRLRLELTMLRLVLSLLLLELTLLMLQLALVLLRRHSLVAWKTLVLSSLRWHVLVLWHLLSLVLRGHGTTVVLLVRVLQLKVWVLLLVLAQLVLRVHLLFIQALPSFILLKIAPVGHVQKLLVA